MAAKLDLTLSEELDWGCLNERTFRAEHTFRNRVISGSLKSLTPVNNLQFRHFNQCVSKAGASTSFTNKNSYYSPTQGEGTASRDCFI
jgi:hypothetical protein